jgi:uncharacterized membrane protein
MAGFFRTRMQDQIAAGIVSSPQDRTHAAAAHVLGAIVGIFTAGLLLPVLATTLVLVINTSRSPFVLFHVNQAAWFQAFVSLVAIVAGVAFVVLYFVTCGIALILLPLALIPWSLSVLLPLWVAYRAYRGEWADYPVIGDYVLDQESPFVDA